MTSKRMAQLNRNVEIIRAARSGASYAEIAEKFGIGYKMALKHCHRAGIRINKEPIKRTEAIVAEVARMRTEGRTMKSIASATASSVSFVYRVLRQMKEQNNAG